MSKLTIFILTLTSMFITSCDDDHSFFRDEEVSFYADGKRFKADKIFKIGSFSNTDTLYIQATDGGKEIEMHLSYTYSNIIYKDNAGKVYNSTFNNNDQLLNIDIESFKDNWLEGEFDCKLFTEDGKSVVFISEGEFEVELD